MRQALFGQEFLLNSSGEIMGIRLGYDHCYEHECGIEHIQRALGIPIDPVENPENWGLKGRTVKIFNGRCFSFFKSRNRACLFYDSCSTPNSVWLMKRFRVFIRHSGGYDPEGFLTAWDKGSFGIIVHEKYISFLKELWEAFERKDIVLGLRHSDNPFEPPSLTICIASKMDIELEAIVRKSDEKLFGERPQ